MDVKSLSNDGLLFHYFSNKKQMDLLYKQQKEIEEEINTRLDILRDKAKRGEFTVKESEEEECQK